MLNLVAIVLIGSLCARPGSPDDVSSTVPEDLSGESSTTEEYIEESSTTEDDESSDEENPSTDVPTVGASRIDDDLGLNQSSTDVANALPTEATGAPLPSLGAGRDERCNQPPSTGRCRASFSRFFFNSTSGSCETFVYGGCGGNWNNFMTRGDCVAACGSREPCAHIVEKCRVQPRRRATCEVNLDKVVPAIKWYYDRGQHQCLPFVFVGCELAGNTFDSRRKCIEACAH